MKTIKYIMALAFVLALFGCQRRPLEYYYKPEARMLLEVDWSDFPERPTGMTVFVYKEGEAPQSYSTSDVDKTAISLSAGRYKMFVMNQSLTEIGGVNFSDMGTYENAEAILSKVASKWYSVLKGVISSSEGEGLIGVGIQPDDLGIGIIQEFNITDAEIQEFQYKYAKWKKGKGKKDGDGEAADDAPYDNDAPVLKTVKVTPHNVVSQLKVKVNIHNIQNLYTVRASMESLAESFLLTQGTTSQKEVAQLIEQWNLVKTSADGKDGYVEGMITTFALPNGVTSVLNRNPQANVLTVQCLHADKKTYTTEQFEVGDKLKITLNPKYYRMIMEVEVGPIYLPNHDPAGDTGGFVSFVEDWDDLVDVDIPI